MAHDQGTRWYLKQQFLYARALVRHRELDPREYLLFDDRQLAFLVVSKVACTSVKRAIGEAYGIDAPDIHAAPEWHRHYGLLDRKRRGYHTFAFVRDPFDRLVSCYRDKILWEPGSAIYPRPYFDIYPFPLPTNMSFEAFARRVARIPDRLADRHFKSQYAQVFRHGRPLTQTLGHLESLAEDWRVIAERYGFRSKLGKSHETATTKGAPSDYRTYYTPELVDLVYGRYESDFLHLGYPHAREELRAWLR